MSTPTAKIYILNLDRAPERLRKLTEALRGNPFPVERFPAIDGAELSAGELRQITAENHFHRPLVANEAASYLSHQRCLENFLRDGVDYCVVFEDDAVPAPDFGAVLATLIAERHAASAPDQAALAWEVLKLSDCGPRYVRIGQSAGREIVECHPVPIRSLAMIWTPGAARKFLARYSCASRPFDMQVRFLWEHGILLQNLRPDLVTDSGTDSNIGARDHLSHGVLVSACYRANFIFRRFFHAARRHGLCRALALEFGRGPA